MVVVQEFINALTLGSIYLLFALGMSLAWGTIGILNFAHGAIFMASAFVASLVVERLSIPLVAVVGLGIMVGAALSLAVQVLAFEPIQGRSTDHRRAEMQILVAGIGIASVPVALAQEHTIGNPFGFLKSDFHAHQIVIAGLHVTDVQVAIIALAILLVLAMSWWLQRSRHGLALRAIGVDREVASIAGVDSVNLARLTMLIAGALAGLAGVLLTYHLGAMAPETGDTFILKAFAAIILGGVGSMLGVVVGSYCLAIAETIVLTQTSGLWVDAVSFGLILLVLLIRTQGLFGRREVRRT